MDFTTPVNLSNNQGVARESRDDQEATPPRRPHGVKRAGNHVYAAWQGNVPAVISPLTEEIFFRFSIDGGATWVPALNEPATNLSKNPGNRDTEARLDADGLGNVYVVWQENDTGKVKFVRLHIAAGKMAIPVAVHTLNVVSEACPTCPGLARAAGTLPDLALDDRKRIHVIWVQGGKVYYRRSTDQGDTFEAPVTVFEGTFGSGFTFNPVCARNSACNLDPEIAVDGQGRASVVWQDGVNVRYRRIVEGSPEPEPEPIATNALFTVNVNQGKITGVDKDAGPTVAASAGGPVHVTWIGIDGDGKQDAFYARSSDGVTFSTLAMTPANVSGLTGVGPADKARITASGDVVALVWFEKVTNNEVFVARSQDGGRASWGQKSQTPL